MKIPVVLSVVHVAIDAEGVLSVDVDGVPRDSEQGRTRGDLRAVIDEITSDLGAPVRVEVREADGSTFTDVATPRESSAAAAAEPSPSSPPPALAGAGFQPGQDPREPAHDVLDQPRLRFGAHRHLAHGLVHAAVAADEPDFGPNVVVLDPSMPTDEINAIFAAIDNEPEFSQNRHAVLFKPGTYGSAEGAADPATAPDIVNGQVGYYTQVAGLGASPDDVVINGAIHAEGRPPATSCPWDGGGEADTALTNFWRSLSNVSINPIQRPVEGDTGVYGVVFRGRRYDTGDRVDYIKAIVQLAVDRDDLGPDLRPWFKEFAAKL